MAREKTSRKMVELAAKMMKSKNADVRKLAASVLTQYEPKKKGKK